MQTFITDFFKQNNPLDRIWLGKVEDNNDPQKLGRVKVRIPLYGEIPKEDLPWATRFGSFATGATNSAFSFSVPDIGSLVVVAFLNKDIYFPFYFASPTNDLTNIAEWLDGYPDSYGYKDKKGNKIVVNEQAGTVLLHHFSGTQIEIANDGSVTINIVKTQEVNVTNNQEITTESTTINSGSVTINAPTTINGDVNINGHLTVSNGCSGCC